MTGFNGFEVLKMVIYSALVGFLLGAATAIYLRR